MHLTPQEQQQINGLVAEVEAASGAQLIVAVIGKADAYPEIPWKAFALAAVTSTLLVTPVELGLVAAPALRTSALGSLVVLGAGLVAALAAMFVPSLGRVLLDRARARMEVEQYARALFLERSMFQTRCRAGILVLISLFEREAAILADSGVREHVTDGQIEAIVERMRLVAREGRVVAAAQGALTELTRLLRGKFEQAAGANELVDALVQERGP
jgi:putative membrane protein